MSIQPLEGSLGSTPFTPFSGLGDGAGALSPEFAPGSTISGDAISRIVPPWLTGAMSNPTQTAMFGPLPGLMQQLMQMLQYFMGAGMGSPYGSSGGSTACPPYGGGATGCPPYGGNEEFFRTATGASEGDPHLSFNGKNLKLVAYKERAQANQRPGSTPPEGSVPMTPPTLSQTPESFASADNISLAQIDRAREFADAAYSDATRRAYASDWRDFQEYCITNGLTAMPAAPQTLVLYLTNLAQWAKLSTIRRRLAAIVQTHRERGLEPCSSHEMVRRVVRGIARTIGASQAKKEAITLEQLRALLLEIHGDVLKAKRDRAMLLLGFAAALRRSELAALTVDDLRFCKEGLRLRIARSKTDKNGEGAEIAIPFVATRSLCAVRALREWLDAAAISAGPIFRSFSLRRRLSDRAIDGRDVAKLVQSLARRARLEGDFGGHSLRAGFVTSAARAKVSLDAIARTTRHKSLAVLMGYIRPAQAFDDVALTAVIGSESQQHKMASTTDQVAEATSTERSISRDKHHPTTVQSPR
jgi:integrase